MGDSRQGRVAPCGQGTFALKPYRRPATAGFLALSPLPSSARSFGSAAGSGRSCRPRIPARPRRSPWGPGRSAVFPAKTAGKIRLPYGAAVNLRFAALSAVLLSFVAMLLSQQNQKQVEVFATIPVLSLRSKLTFFSKHFGTKIGVSLNFSSPILQRRPRLEQ